MNLHWGLHILLHLNPEKASMDEDLNPPNPSYVALNVMAVHTLTDLGFVKNTTHYLFS